MDSLVFSIAICTYNGEKTLSLAIDAILNLRKSNEYMAELLLIDNASKDRTREICLSYEKKDPRIKYLYEAEPGLSNARKCAATHAIGDWMIYVDDDNILNENWLVELYNCLSTAPSNVGILNGAVIAVPAEPLSDDETMRLKTLYKNLACTHIENMDAPAAPPPFPFGAGMCIKTDALRKILENGWLTLSGRKGGSLASGEDTELANKCFSLGYTFIYNDKMHMQHLIPKSRLSRDYTDRLIKGLTEGWYAHISTQKHYVRARFVRAVKYLLKFLRASIQKHSKMQPKKELALQDLVRSKTFLNCVWNDKLFKKT